MEREKLIEYLCNLFPEYDSQEEWADEILDLLDVSERLHSSLGECSPDHNYTIKVIDGEWWIEHNQVGSAEPLKQWIDREINVC